MDELQAAIDEFVAKVRSITRREAIEALQGAFGGNPVGTRRGPGRPPANGGARRGKDRKRDPKFLEALVSKLEGAIKSKPGRRIEQIGAELGMRTKELALPVKKLLVAKKIRKTGNRRATKYFPV